METYLILNQNYKEAAAPVKIDVKMIIDMVLAAIALIVFSPVILFIAIAIKLEGSGPVLFRQERVGYKGKIFTLFKFRTMVVDAESKNIPQLYKGKNDPRLTKVGRFLRNHHLDEFPQLWNVIRGDMSFVGHRPERKYFIDQIMAVDPKYRLLYQLRPGLFSKATLYNGYTDTMDKMLSRLQMDLDYLYTRSTMLDMQIIFLTTISIVLGRKF